MAEALRDDVANADRPTRQQARDEAALDFALARRVRRMIARSDKRESARRREDRVGGNLFFSNHWAVRMPDGRAAWTVNLARPLIEDKIALMTKNRPIPVVESTGVGDEEGPRIMRSILQQWWTDEGLDAKLEHALYLSNATRTSAIKVRWDPALNGGAGGIAAGVLPGWRILMDPSAPERKRLTFAGDRAAMMRWRAMQLYPKAAERIRLSGAAKDAGGEREDNSPLDDMYRGGGGDVRPGVATIDGVPTLTAEGSIEPSQAELRELVEVAEVYWRDPTMVEREVPKKDSITGETIRKVKMGEDGLPSFREATRRHVLADGQELELPAFELEMEDEMETKFVPKYPFWRRTTVLMQGDRLEKIDDTAWDFELPYAYFIDGRPLEGMWQRGSLLELRGLQTDTNITLSLETDMRRFASLLAAIAYDDAGLEQNTLSLMPGDVIRIRGPKGSFEWVKIPPPDASWLEKIRFNIDMMRLILGLDGVMSGQAQGRLDSAAAYDFLGDISGARIAKCATRMEWAIADLMGIVADIAREAYSEKHSVRVERETGKPTYERITPSSLRVGMRIGVLVGSQLAWTESAKRARALADVQAGVCDKIGFWQQTNYPDWQNMKLRMEREAAEHPNMPPVPPPPRTRQQIPAGGRKPRARAGAAAGA